MPADTARPRGHARPQTPRGNGIALLARSGSVRSSPIPLLPVVTRRNVKRLEILSIITCASGVADD
eukprot:scaffold2668_cov319-Prasinococcus_capsulatus_cf.AAC.9